MSEFKFSPNLFLEKAELNRFKRFLDTDGFRNFLIQNSNEYGLIRKENEAFTNALVQEDVGLTVKINPIKAIDSNGKFISNPTTSLLAIPADSNWYWIKIAYQTTTEELGTFSIDGNGNLVCTSNDAELLAILRGQPNYPSRITFTNATNNILEYDILEVIDNQNAVLQGSFIAESNLKLAVVGTFTRGYVALTNEKYIFQYDSCLITLVVSNTISPPTHTSGLEFIIGRVKNNGTTLKIEDKRNEIWKVDSNYFLHNLDVLGNPLIGVEQITYDDPLSTLDRNIIQVAWAFTTASFAVNLKLNTITISGGKGGKFKTSNFNSVFLDGDFDNWRVYVSSGVYYKTKTSSLVGSNIELIMENISSNEFFSDIDSTVSIIQNLIITPDVEEIELIFVADPASTNEVVEQRKLFPINQAYCRVPLSVYADTGVLYNIKYRYKHIKDYSPTFTIPSDTVGFYNESQFDTKGNIIVSPVASPYIANAVNGFIPLQLNADAYSNFKGRIDLGDVQGVNYNALSNATQVIQLYVKTDKTYQFFVNANFTLTQDLFINLNRTLIDNVTAIREGNKFTINFSQPVTCGAYKVRIVQDYIDPVTYTLLQEFDQNSFDWIYTNPNTSSTTQTNGLITSCIFKPSKWITGVIGGNSVEKIRLISTGPTQGFSAGVNNPVSGTLLTTPNDGVTRFYHLIFRCIYVNNTDPAVVGMGFRIHNITDNIDYDYVESGYDAAPASSSLKFNVILMDYVSIGPNKQIEIQVTPIGSNGDIRAPKFIMLEQ